MAKIIYGVAGEGFGHSSRSHLIAQHLIEQGHDIIFAASGKSLLYMRRYFGQRVKEVYGPSFVFKDGQLARMRTVKKNIKGFVSEHYKNSQLYRDQFKPFEPDLVISDFEPFSAWWAWWNKVPCISINNEHLLTLCKLEHIEKQWLPKLASDTVTRIFCIDPVKYLIMSFFEAPLKTKRAVIVPPVVRQAVETLKPTQGEHILYYAGTYMTMEKLLNIFKAFPHQKFIIYSFDNNFVQENCVFRKIATDGFLDDLASCRAVIATAGFSLLSECMYLRKNMLLLPQHGQYEQMLNAHYAQKLGLASSTMSLDKNVLAAFLETLDKPRIPDKTVIWPDNKKFLHILEDTMAKI